MKKTDIRNFGITQTAELHFKDARGNLMYLEYDETGKPIAASAMKAVIYSPASPEAARVSARQSNRTIELMRQIAGTEVSADEMADRAAEDLADITKEFINIEYGDHSGREVIKAVYRDRELGFLARQVEKFHNDWGNFSRSSAKS